MNTFRCYITGIDSEMCSFILYQSRCQNTFKGERSYV